MPAPNAPTSAPRSIVPSERTREHLMRRLGSALALSCLTIACSGEPSASDEPGWREVFRDLPGALISVSGTSEKDVWTVGGDPGDGSGAFVLHFDGTGWRRLSTGQNADLWWAHPFLDVPVFIGGSKGTILRYQNDTF